MANIPGGGYVPPGVYGPTSIEIIKTKEGYSIGWAPQSAWKTIFINGPIREIARDLLVKAGNVEVEHKYPFYGCIFVSFKPKVECRFHTNLISPMAVNVQFAKELTEELEKLKPLLPFV